MFHAHPHCARPASRTRPRNSLVFWETGVLGNRCFPRRRPSRYKSLNQGWFHPRGRVVETSAALQASHIADNRIRPANPPIPDLCRRRHVVVPHPQAPRNPSVREYLCLSSLPGTMPTAGVSCTCCGGQCARRIQEMPLSTYWMLGAPRTSSAGKRILGNVETQW